MLKLVFSIITVIVTIILAITCVYVKSNIYTRRFEHVAIASNLFWGAGIVGGAFFSLLIMWTLIEGYYAVSATFAAILWVANSLMYGWLNMYTTYDENGFTYGVLPVGVR